MDAACKAGEGGGERGVVSIWAQSGLVCCGLVWFSVCFRSVVKNRESAQRNRDISHKYILTKAAEFVSFLNQQTARGNISVCRLFIPLSLPKLFISLKCTLRAIDTRTESKWQQHVVRPELASCSNTTANSKWDRKWWCKSKL